MKYIGAHVSASGGVEKTPGRGAEIGANAIAIFTKNQRQWKAPAITDEQAKAFKAALTESGIRPEHVLPHTSYLINIATPDPENREKSIAALIDEVERADQLGLTMVNFHPGSGLKELTEEETVTAVAEGMKRVLDETQNVALIVESTAGQGAHIGYKFEHLAGILEQVGRDDRVGICIDTCHMFGAGFDLRTIEGYEETISAFDRIVGLKHLKGIHLNDAKVELGSRKDRHDSIGAGTLGVVPFHAIMRDKRLDDMPIVLETPDPDLWAEEIAFLRKLESGEFDSTAKAPAQK